jgi:hypothetical protein
MHVMSRAIFQPSPEMRCRPSNPPPRKDVAENSRVGTTVGFCLVGQSSTSPIVSFHHSKQIPVPHSIGMPWRFMVGGSLMSGGLGRPAALPSGDPKSKAPDASSHRLHRRILSDRKILSPRQKSTADTQSGLLYMICFHVVPGGVFAAN